MLRSGNDLEAEFFGFACQGSECTFFETTLVLLLTAVDVVAAVLQHSVDQESQFMGRRNKAFGLSESKTHAAAKSAERTAARGCALRT